MAEYIEREAAITTYKTFGHLNLRNALEAFEEIPAADVVEEENILKFYYVRSIDEYWIGRRIDNFYYAEYDFKIRQWVWTHSRYLPWGGRVVSQTSAWKEHTYPSEPEEIPFEDWLQGFIKKVHPAADVRPVVRGAWRGIGKTGRIFVCSACDKTFPYKTSYCPNCGADMRDQPKEEA